jgi:xanthine dehydrogenase YagS FAD-binding subunit
MCVALAALDAVIVTQNASVERRIAITDFHTLPGSQPEIETALASGEIITAVELPEMPFFSRSHYLKVRDRSSYSFALASAAVALEIESGHVKNARVALGGVATKPWRSREAEEALVGKPAVNGTYRDAAEAALHGAKAQRDNGFKIDLAKRTLVRALTRVGELA